MNQERAPIYEALKKHMQNRVVPFDVPGHKGGRGTPDLTKFLGEKCLRADVNSQKPLDNLCHPISVIKEAEELAAAAFSAAHAFFMVNGTTGAVQSMISAVCKQGDKIIMPRNVHRSAINALVLCGAVPVYVNPGVNKKLGIPLGMSVCDVERAIAENPDAKAILVNNPTYYGICSNLAEIVRLAHTKGMFVLADEAHGTHFYFGDELPLSAMRAGADMAAVSMHKTGGSLTQSSFLLLGSVAYGVQRAEGNVQSNNCIAEHMESKTATNHVFGASCSENNQTLDAGYVRQIINLTQTTSGSYLLLSSLDLARKNLAVNGKEIFAKAMELARYARSEINKIEGYNAFAEELINGDTVFDFDETKLSVHTREIGLAGIEVYDMLRDEYDIQIEFGDIGNILAIISAGDRLFEIERLVGALSEIKRLHSKDKEGMFDHEYIDPQVAMPPQQAFYAAKRQIPIEQSAGEICGEFVMCYPPGIPILAPGEVITAEILDYIQYAKEKGCSLTGTQDIAIERINVLK